MRLERVFERNHQLNSLERAEPKLLDCRPRREIGPARVLGDESRKAIAARDGPRLRRAAEDPLANRRAFQFSRALRTRQILVGPDERAPTLLTRTIASFVSGRIVNRMLHPLDISK